ncbi:hypothetical protein GCM10028792_22210 [Salinisphaera aquimarina]
MAVRACMRKPMSMTPASTSGTNANIDIMIETINLSLKIYEPRYNGYRTNGAQRHLSRIPTTPEAGS